MKQYDVIIIGGGPGGYVAGIRAAQKGLSVCVVEKDQVGGTCLNRGCIPSKSLFYSAKTLSTVSKGGDYGVNVSDFSFELKKAMERKNSVVDKLRDGVEGLLKGNKVDLIKGMAVIEGGEKGAFKVNVDVWEGKPQVIEASQIIIATGSEPLDIKELKIDRENVLTSTEVLNLTETPESMIIVGGGVMGCEFASMFSRFGSKVTIIEQMDSILATEDKQIVRVVEKKFKSLGIDMHLSSTVKSVEAGDGSVKVVLDNGSELEAEKMLVTVGRSYNSEGIGLESVGVETTDRGSIKVNEFLETNVEGIYAIGDVIGGMLLAHVASKEGEVAVENISASINKQEGVAASGSDDKMTAMDYSAVPLGIFTDPEIASIGMKEKDAKKDGKDVNIGRFSYLSGSKAMCMGEAEGMVQVITDKETGKVLGASIVGDHATDLIGELVLAVRKGLTAEDIYETIHAHPTMPEMVMEAAEDTLGIAIHKIGRRR